MVVSNAVWDCNLPFRCRTRKGRAFPDTGTDNAVPLRCGKPIAAPAAQKKRFSLSPLRTNGYDDGPERMVRQRTGIISMQKSPPGDITKALDKTGRGDEAAAAALLPLVYEQLRTLAGSYFRRPGPDQTLQPTALVHEAFMKLAGPTDGNWQSRAHFFAVAARAMRQILADHARRRKATKRGVGQQRVTLSGLVTPPAVETQIDLIALDEALAKLTELSPRQGRIVELRFLAGLCEDEVAHLLGVTSRTVQRDWRMARAFLRCELSGQSLT